jgi:hypothetical protein
VLPDPRVGVPPRHLVQIGRGQGVEDEPVRAKVSQGGYHGIMRTDGEHDERD